MWCCPTATRIQNYGMRLILAPSSELCAHLRQTTLSRRCQILQLNMMHRCLHNQALGYLQSHFSMNGSVSKCQCITRGRSKVYIRTEVGRNSFSFKGAQDWNQLPSHIRNTVEPPNRGHFGTAAFILSSEVVLFSEVV